MLEHPRAIIIAAFITGVAAICAAFVGLGLPFIEKVAKQLEFTPYPTYTPYPTFTPSAISAPATAPPMNIQVPTIVPAPSTRVPTSVLCYALPNGEPVSPNSLARFVGGDSRYWTDQGPCVWRYMNKNINATFRHPGNNIMLTYWAGFPAPTNVPSDCVIEETVYDGGPTRTIKCISAGATFSADGVGLHLVP